jgi:alkylation response protein AidB-like acyl-CoA dehydrogenase
MDFEFTPEQEAFRQELRAWPELNVPPGLHTDPSGSVTAPNREVFEQRLEFQKKLHENRWIGIWWPREYGGRGCQVEIQRNIIGERIRGPK